MQTSSLSRALLVGLSAALMYGCNSASVDDEVKAGKESLRSGDTKRAVISAKSALQQQPDSAAARLLLSEALLESGEPVAAATELKKLDGTSLARDTSVSVLLARALLESGQSKEVISRFAGIQLANPSANAELLRLIASAHLAQRNLTAASAAIEQALQATPPSAPTLLTQSDVAYASGDVAKAQQLLKQVVTADPGNAQAWLRIGVLTARENGDATEAANAFTRALKAKPDLHTARSNLIFMLLAKGDLKAVTEQVAIFSRALPQHPQTAYFESQIAFQGKNYTAALEAIQKSLKASPDNVLALALAGEIYLAVGQVRQAEQALTHGLSLAPNSFQMRQVLAQVYLQTNRADAALATLKPLLDQNLKTSAKAQFLAGEAHLMRGNVNESIANLELASKLDPSNIVARIQLILTKGKSITPRETSKALKELAASDKGILADLALFNLNVQLSDYIGALAAIESIATKTPKSALPFSLRAGIHLKQKDLVAARKALGQALALEPNSITTLAALARIDVAEGKPDDAKNRFRSVLKTESKNYAATMGLAKLLNQGTEADEYARLLRSAIEASPAAAEPRTLLVRHHLSRNEAKLAASIAQAAAVAIPDDPDVLDWLGKAQIANSDINQAVTTYSKLVTLQARSPYSYVRLAGALLAAKDKNAAEKNLRRALQVDPAFFPAQEALVKLVLIDKRRDDALAVAKAAQKQRPNDPAGYLLEGDIEAQLGRHPSAIGAYRTTLKKFPAPLIAIKLYEALLVNRQVADADKLVVTWSAEHPKDKAVLAFAGDAMLNRQDYVTSERYFRGVLTIEPNNIAALNNVAWLLIKLHRPGAVEMVARAIKIQPDSPALLDTLAQALSEEKTFKRAIDTQKRAISLAPKDLGLKLNLAKIYIASGDKSAAREQLDALKALGDKFPASAEVAQLLKSL